jgi:hypothetical protein
VTPSIDAVIVGAQRSGTTWLATSLDAHPNVCLAKNKEAHFFDDSSVQARGLTPQHFAEAFPAIRKDQISLDATPSYLYLPGCLPALKRHNPDAKVVAILRDPGQRAVSQYYHSTYRGVEKQTILAAFLLEQALLRAEARPPLSATSSARDHSYLDRGRYSAQVSNLLSLFPDSLVIPFPLIKFEPSRTLDLVQAYLGIDVTPLPPSEQRNSVTRPKHRVLAGAVSLFLRSDTRATLRMLGWNPSALDEGGR